jgi:hypothetical protein
MDGRQPTTLPSQADIRAFVYAWYRKLDIHAPVEELLAGLSDTAEMVLPETTLRGIDAFKAWYQGGNDKLNLPGVINLFFDEKHELKRVDVSVAANADGSSWRAEVSIVVRWEARRWRPPAAKSDYLGFDAWQRWVVKLRPDTNTPVIERYIVDALEPLQGSVSL